MPTDRVRTTTETPSETREDPHLATRPTTSSGRPVVIIGPDNQPLPTNADHQYVYPDRSPIPTNIDGQYVNVDGSPLPVDSDGRVIIWPTEDTQVVSFKGV